MEYMKIAIVTDDRPYGEALARSLHIGNRNFDLTLLTGDAFCRRWEDGGQTWLDRFDLILWDQEGIEKVYGGNLVRLTGRESETGESGPGNSGNRFSIYKYDHRISMTAQIYEIYEKLTGRRPAGTRPDRVEVFAVASWQGGCGCTALAMAMGQELARFENRRVLYLSLEGIESTCFYMKSAAKVKTAGEYLYRLVSSGGREIPFTEEYLVQDSFGVRAFGPSAGCNPLSMAGPGEIDLLLGALTGSGSFDVILIDAGNSTGENARQSLKQADRIIVVSSREEPAREAGYMTFLSLICGEKVHDRCIRARNMGPEAAGSGARESGMPGFPAAPNVFISKQTGTGQRPALEGSFGKDIHELIELCYN